MFYTLLFKEDITPIAVSRIIMGRKRKPWAICRLLPDPEDTRSVYTEIIDIRIT